MFGGTDGSQSAHRPWEVHKEQGKPRGLLKQTAESAPLVSTQTFCVPMAQLGHSGEPQGRAWNEKQLERETTAEGCSKTLFLQGLCAALLEQREVRLISSVFEMLFHSSFMAT